MCVIALRFCAFLVVTPMWQTCQALSHRCSKRLCGAGWHILWSLEMFQRPGVSLQCKTATECAFSKCVDRAGCVRPACQGWHDPYCGRTSLQFLQTPVLLDLETPVLVQFRQVGSGSIPTGQVFGARTVSTAVTGDDIVFVNGLGADVEANHHEQNVRYLEQSMWLYSSTTWVSKHAVTVEGGQAVLWDSANRDLGNPH